MNRTCTWYSYAQHIGTEPARYSYAQNRTEQHGTATHSTLQQNSTGFKLRTEHEQNSTVYSYAQLQNRTAQSIQHGRSYAAAQNSYSTAFRSYAQFTDSEQHGTATQQNSFRTFFGYSVRFSTAQ